MASIPLPILPDAEKGKSSLPRFLQHPQLFFSCKLFCNSVSIFIIHVLGHPTSTSGVPCVYVPPWLPRKSHRPALSPASRRITPNFHIFKEGVHSHATVIFILRAGAPLDQEPPLRERIMAETLSLLGAQGVKWMKILGDNLAVSI